MPILGTPRWGASLTEPSGRVIWQAGEEGMTDWSFTRELCDISEAKLVLPSNPALANRVEPWLHALTIYADLEPVWHGMVMTVKSTSGKLTIDAADGAAFFKRRRLPSGRTWDQADAAQVMAQVVTDGMGPSDPLNVVDHMHAADSRVWVVVDESANTVLIDSVISDLVDAGLEWTFFAGALLIGPVAARVTLPTLTDAHLGGGVEVTKEGKDVVTDVIVTGDGVWAQRAIDDDRIVIQSIEKGDKLVTADECATLAESVLAERGVAPVTVTVDDGALLPTAPVTINDLVPGVRVPVSSSQTGITVGTLQMIEKVTVDAGAVKVSLGTPSVSVESREEFPPPATMDHQSPWVREQASKNQQAALQGEAEGTEPALPM